MLVAPRRKEVRRINGSAQVVMDDELLDMLFNGHRPDFAILIRVEATFFTAESPSSARRCGSLKSRPLLRGRRHIHRHSSSSVQW